MEMTENASWRAINLIMSIAGGKLIGRDDVFTGKKEKTEILLRLEKIRKVLGYSIDENEVGKILRALGINLFPRKEVILCSVPAWRNDIKEEIDLIEEVVRIHGYENIPKPEISESEDYYDTSFFPEIVRDFRMRLSGLGFCEALNYSFLEIEDLEKFGLKSHYKILNPISKENEVLRPSLLPSLYKNLLSNIGHGVSSVSLFEYGKVYTDNGEKETFAALMFGNVWQEWWKWEKVQTENKYNFYFAGGIIKNILPSKEFLIAKNLNPQPYFHPGKTASILYHGKPIGHFGIIKPSINKDLKDEVVYFEMDIESVKDLKCKNILFEPFAKFPSVKRDISVIADKSLPFDKIEHVLKSIMRADNILKEYNLFSVYSNDEKIGKDKVGYSLRLTYRNIERTLTDSEVNGNVQKLLDKLKKDLSVFLRT